MPEAAAAFFPNARRATKLKKEVDLKLLKSLGYLLGVARDGTRIDLGRESERVRKLEIARTNGAPQLSCMAFAYHDRLLSAIRKQDVQDVQRLIAIFDSFCTTSRRPEVVAFGSDNYSPAQWGELEATLASAYESEYTAYGFSVGAPAQNQFLQTSALIAEALAEIAATDRESYDEFRAVISDVVLVQSDVIVEGTCFNALGCIFLKVEDAEQGWVHFADVLIHEVAHHVLYALWSREALIRNDRQGLYASPFRSEQRPLSGIFQAMWVLARMIRFKNRYLRTGERFKEMEQYYSSGKGYQGGRLEEAYAATYDIVRSYADLSPLGCRIMEASKTMALGELDERRNAYKAVP